MLGLDRDKLLGSNSINSTVRTQKTSTRKCYNIPWNQRGQTSEHVMLRYTRQLGRAKPHQISRKQGRTSTVAPTSLPLSPSPEDKRRGEEKKWKKWHRWTHIYRRNDRSSTIHCGNSPLRFDPSLAPERCLPTTRPLLTKLAMSFPYF